MDLRAILMVGGRPPGSSAEVVGGVPMAYLDVLGAPVLERVLQRLLRFGVSGASIISDAPADAEPFARRFAVRPHASYIEATGDRFWKAAEEEFERHAEQGAELVLALRLGPYLEVDYEELIQHHLDGRCPVTAAVDAQGEFLDLFVLSASRRNDAAVLFRSQFSKLRKDCEPFRVAGYANRLRSAAELRQLACDGLLCKNAIVPVGTEIKPGVWVGESARIHRTARIVAPAYIGAHTRLRAASLITRGSVIEHHCEIDCGTVVENATALPFSYVGAGLDVMHSVVGFRRIVHLSRGAEVEISDARLISMVYTNALSRTLGSAAALFAFLPKQIFRGMFPQSQHPSSAEIPESLEASAPLKKPEMEAQGSGPAASEFPSNLAVARRYGDEP